MVPKLRPTVRPSFQSAIEYWSDALHQRGIVAPFQWLLRENLRLGGGPTRASVTLSYQCFAPRLEESDARAVYAWAARWDDLLRFELLAATPDVALVTMRRTSGFVSEIERYADWELQFQYEPSYATVAEIRAADEWRELIRNEPASPELEGILKRYPRIAPV